MCRIQCDEPELEISAERLGAPTTASAEGPGGQPGTTLTPARLAHTPHASSLRTSHSRARSQPTFRHPAQACPITEIDAEEDPPKPCRAVISGCNQGKSADALIHNLYATAQAAGIAIKSPRVGRSVTCLKSGTRRDNRRRARPPRRSADLVDRVSWPDRGRRRSGSGRYVRLRDGPNLGKWSCSGPAAGPGAVAKVYRTCREEGGLHRRASRTHRSHTTVTTALPRACPCST
jgi:hypothetical protein